MLFLRLLAEGGGCEEQAEGGGGLRRFWTGLGAGAAGQQIHPHQAEARRGLLQCEVSVLALLGTPDLVGSILGSEIQWSECRYLQKFNQLKKLSQAWECRDLQKILWNLIFLSVYQLKNLFQASECRNFQKCCAIDIFYQFSYLKKNSFKPQNAVICKNILKSYLFKRFPI